MGLSELITPVLDILPASAKPLAVVGHPAMWLLGTALPAAAQNSFPIYLYMGQSSFCSVFPILKAMDLPQKVRVNSEVQGNPDSC